MVHVRKNYERPAPEIVSAFFNLAAATVHEASGRKGAVDSAIKPVARGVRVCGPALTVQCAPGDNLMLHKALEIARSGDVIVAEVAGEYNYGYWGSLMTVSAVARQLGGLVINGCVRDSREIIELGFPVFCRGFAIKGTTKREPGLVNYPLFFGKVLVSPGDLVLGDDDGVVIVRYAEIEEVLAKSLKRVNDEREKAEVLRTGVSSVEYNRLGSVFEALGLTEEEHAGA